MSDNSNNAHLGRETHEDNSYIVNIAMSLSNALKSFEKSVLLMTSCTRSLLCDTEIITYAETVPRWFLLK